MNFIFDYVFFCNVEFKKIITVTSERRNWFDFFLCKYRFPTKIANLKYLHKAYFYQISFKSVTRERYISGMVSVRLLKLSNTDTSNIPCTKIIEVGPSVSDYGAVGRTDWTDRPRERLYFKFAQEVEIRRNCRWNIGFWDQFFSFTKTNKILPLMHVVVWKPNK